VKTLDLGDATILPGFIEPHAHSLRAGVPSDVVLRHGITTIRDLGGPLRAMSGGEGSLRLLTSGPILTAPGGYPIPAFGEGDLARAVDSEESGRAAVRDLASGGASVIKIALEPGFEPGAPWTRHGHGAGHSAAGAAPSAWPLMPLATVRAIVEEAHRQGRKTIAHAGEERGVAIALDAGVDEWAHVPCSRVSDALLRRAAEQGVVVVTTIDTLSACPGVAENARKLIEFGATLIYGAEIAHGDVPWGVDAEELNAMRAAGMEPLAILRAATSRSAEALGLAPLGTLAPGAPADLVAVRGDALRDYKRLEYPDLVISGGEVIVDWNRATAARDRYPEKGGPTPVPSPPGA
jgi:imidazolonepropionase-like amidohydrolase